MRDAKWDREHKKRTQHEPDQRVTTWRPPKVWDRRKEQLRFSPDGKRLRKTESC